MKALLFAVMPFGKKRDPSRKHEIDFDAIYEKAIKPVAHLTDVEIIRADEEKTGGIIHVPMFERLLLAEIVVADVTIPNPNVYYELGVRHCAKPGSTILIFDKETKLPFDIGLIRAVPYQLAKGQMSDDEAERLAGEIAKMIDSASAKPATKDSPLYRLFPSLRGPELKLKDAESFRERVRRVEEVRTLLEQARHVEDRGKALEKVKDVEASLSGVEDKQAEILVDLLHAYRDVKAWDEVIDLAGRVLSGLPGAAVIREQQAFALNRRKGAGDREQAEGILRSLVTEYGPTAETCGLIGRIQKDWYEESKEAGDKVKAAAYLDEAIKWYRLGFEADPRDYYPGINAATLLFRKGDKESLDEMGRLVWAVWFAAERRGGVDSSDYWDVATVLEASVLIEDWRRAEQAAQRIQIFKVPDWCVETTIRNLEIIHGARSDQNKPSQELDALVDLLKQAI
jgi:tetratricopeptide (TPR) repeat protein